ncbi:hypothetical protein [Thiomicrorhabdus chilensis]|uniref:hypothetical protein n=1 Tax=Thiomicrorhabdus chilensis TaxID=63656 RepID=UPI00048D13E7|nr:hypothetical protein [Thiomicrorhabdus chilensis]
METLHELFQVIAVSRPRSVLLLRAGDSGDLDDLMEVQATPQLALKIFHLVSVHGMGEVELTIERGVAIRADRFFFLRATGSHISL